MRYLTYKNINEAGFIEAKEKLNEIENITTPIMNEFEFSLNRRNYNEVLCLDYTIGYKNNFGNIGITFDEAQSILTKSLFRFYILKSHDENEVRYYKKVELEKLLLLEELHSKAPLLLGECVSIYEALSESDLSDFVILK